uniref:Uncharacterized protein n=1 Tax=Arundo donax TaxID=35708 RepID=A0A0A8ZRN8_ARUDO
MRRCVSTRPHADMSSPLGCHGAREEAHDGAGEGACSMAKRVHTATRMSADKVFDKMSV